MTNNRRAEGEGHFAFLKEPEHRPAALCRQAHVRRRITPEAGRGLEKLGHALEYLADEFVHDGCAVAEDYGRLQAIQLLAALNRQIYLACSVEPTLSERICALALRLLK